MRCLIRPGSRARKRAPLARDDEVTRLLVHGLLHLVGHDHARSAERRAMQAEERRLCEALAG